MTSRNRMRRVAERLSGWLSRGKSAPAPERIAAGEFASVDSWGVLRAPSDTELVKSFRGTAYACANLCAQGVASVPLRLYVTTREGEAAPRCRTRALDPARLKSLAARPNLASSLAGALSVTEVTEHPLLELLSKVNEELDGFSLIELTDLYLEIVGSAYWWLGRNALGIIESIWVLAPQHVVVKRSRSGRAAGYEYGWGADKRTFAPESIISFHSPDLRDPYTRGWSPLRAAFESVALEEKTRSHAHAVLENGARPDVIVSARGEYSGLGEAEAERLERRFMGKFRRGRNGGVMVISDEVDVKPLTFSPKDTQSILLHDMARQSIANAFGVPMSLLQTKDVNRANAEAAHYQLARNAILPRCRRIEQRLTQKLCTLFDKRLFLAFDSPVPSDREMTLKERQAYLAAGVITPDEVRRQIGMPALEKERSNG